MADSNAKSLREVVREFEAAVDSTTSQIKLDLERARSMVRDATARLNRSFELLHVTAASQREALQAVSDAFYDREHSGRSFATSTEMLMRQFVDEIVRVSKDSMRIIEQLADLQTQVGSIVGCADAIDGLARETRFIAFNARVETHRAGDAGRTFKVVADEVKRLANASASLSNQIRENVSACNAHLTQAHQTAIGLASHDLSQAIESHRGLSGAITKLDDVNKALDHMLETLATAVSEAVRALQFEDMVSQILTATIQRVEKLGGHCVRAAHALEGGSNGDRAGPLADIVSGMHVLSERLAVQQSNTDQGTVELF